MTASTELDCLMGGCALGRNPTQHPALEWWTFGEARDSGRAASGTKQAGPSELSEYDDRRELT